MSNDILRLDNTKPINVEYAVCSTLPTGYRSKLLKFGVLKYNTQEIYYGQRYRSSNRL